MKARLEWLCTARPTQLTPKGNWQSWLILAGRGWGKTRTGAEDLAHYALWHKGSRCAVVAPTYADARDTCLEGQSGLLGIIPRPCISAWNRSLGELILFNDSRIKLFSADQPERLRGPQHHRVWADELAAWANPDAFDQMLFGLRLGDNPQCVITTTPKPKPLLLELLARAGQDVFLTRGHTFDNSAHLAASAMAQLRARYDGTRLGRQELAADILQDAEGALWQRAQIDSLRVSAAPTPLERIVLACDPALGGGKQNDETGLIVAALGVDGHAYILADHSGRYSPQSWANKAVALLKQYEATRLVAEVNAGGELIAALLHSMSAHVPLVPVRAVQGKVGRALPVAALYERGLVHHVGSLPELEDQLCRFTLQGLSGGGSPDRLDALVWALTDLLLQPQAPPRIRGL